MPWISIQGVRFGGLGFWALTSIGRDPTNADYGGMIKGFVYGYLGVWDSGFGVMVLASV